jgi:hypothetical protein
VEAVVDPERLVVRSVVKTPTHAFEILGGAVEVRVSRVAPVGGRPWEVAPSFPPLALDAFAGLADLERWLVAEVPHMSPVPGTIGGGQPEASAALGQLEVTPPPRNALTLEALARVFGADAMLPPNVMVELVQEFRHGGTRYRFLATREMGSRFKGRLIGPNGDVWSDKFDLLSFPGTAKVVAAALGAREPGAGAVAAGPGGPDLMAVAGVPGTWAGQDVQPMAEEVWVMRVVVEQAGPNEVRYVGTDIDGQPYGAARVLAKADFEEVFSQDRGGWRLLVRIDQVQDGSVLYRQLDRQRQAIGAPRKMPTAILVANFVPESTVSG